MYELLHAGFDTIDLAFAGALPAETFDVLAGAREEALERQEPILANIGPGNVAMHVSGHGMRGGYAFITDTGPLGAKWMFKKNTDIRQWNIFASPRATMLLAYGYQGTRDRLFQELDAMGAKVADHSINRVDFAMDFRTRDFELKAERFVAHAHTKIRSHWSEALPAIDNDRPSAVLRGRRLESVTIGKMPGRQVIVYDKRREAIDRQKRYWFDRWGIEPTDRDFNVWRVEVRAGKKHLKDRWAIRTFEDLEAGIGDVFRYALSDLRYLADHQSDSNVSRQQLHPLWEAAQSVAETKLCDFMSGLLPGQIVEIARAEAQRRYSVLAVSSAIGLAVALDMNDEEILAELPNLAYQCVQDATKSEPDRIQKALNRTRARLHFIAK